MVSASAVKTLVYDHIILKKEIKQSTNQSTLSVNKPIMSTFSNSDLTASEYGRYTTFLNTKKIGPNTPVRRSLRIRRGVSRPTANEARTTNLSVFSHKSDERIAKTDDTTVEELCGLFKTVLLIVGSHSLSDVDAKNEDHASSQEGVRSGCIED